jgi:uncharacterized RDD family membrane protein YckC
MNEYPLHNAPRAGLPRRLLAGLYDWLLVIALMMAVSVPVVALRDDAVTPGNPLYRVGLAWVAWVFFAGFWSRGGQTLGMRSWRLRLVSDGEGRVSFGRATLRFAYAWISALPCGLGFWWALFDPEGRTWHDRWSGTYLILLPKRSSALAS